MRLYHLAKESEEIYTVLKPQVPFNLHFEGVEDDKTPCICFSKTIVGCLEALGKGVVTNDILGEHYVARNGNHVAISPHPVYLYEVDVATDDSHYVSTEMLVAQAKVPDAHLTNESWYLKEIQPSKVYRFVLSEVLYGAGGSIQSLKYACELVKQPY